MVLPGLDLLTIAGIPTAVGASEAVHQQGLLDEEAQAPERQEPFYLDVYCDAQSRKKDEVHGTIVILKDGKVLSFDKVHTSCALLISIRSFGYGQKTPRQGCQKRILKAERHRTPSQASTTPSQAKTSIYRTGLYPRLPCSAS